MPRSCPPKGKPGKTAITLTFTSDREIVAVEQGPHQPFNLSQEDLIGRKLGDIMTAYSVETVMLFVKSVLKTGKPKWFEVSLLEHVCKTPSVRIKLERTEIDSEYCLKAVISFSHNGPAVHSMQDQTEEMAAMGILATDFADEISVPTSDIKKQVPRLREVLNDITPLLEKACGSDQGLETARQDYPALKKDLDNLMTDLESGAKQITESMECFDGVLQARKERFKKTIDLRKVLGKCVRLTKDLRDDGGITLDLIVNNRLSGIQGDEEKLEHIFMNLLFRAHAILGSKPGGISISAGCDSSSGFIRIEIESAVSEKKDRRAGQRICDSAMLHHFELGSVHKMLKPFNGRFGMRTAGKGRMIFQVEIPVPEQRMKRGPVDSTPLTVS